MVEDGQRVNAEVTNAAFISRTQNSNTIAIVSLDNESSGPNVENAQLAINRSRNFVSQEQEISLEGEIDIETDRNQTVPVKADDENVTASNTPFGDKVFFDGMEITLVGTDSTNRLRIIPVDEPKGCAMNGPITLGFYSTITFKYIAHFDRFVETGRNHL